LGVEQGVAGAWVTCPHCLTQVMNPWQQVTATPAPGPAQTTAPPGPPRCPECGRDVEANWRFCPHCNGDLRGRKETRSAGAAVDVEVKRDAVGSASGLSFLAMIVLLGFLVFLCGGGGQIAFRGAGTWTEPLVLLLLLIGLITAGTLALKSRSRNWLTVSVAVVAFMVCGVLALILFFAFVCIPMLAPEHSPWRAPPRPGSSPTSTMKSG
jgi:hypothetical protein